MTTICFDGKELVADSTVTYTDAVVRGGVEVMRPRFERNQINKIIVPQGALELNGEQIEAMAGAGSLDVMLRATHGEGTLLCDIATLPYWDKVSFFLPHDTLTEILVLTKKYVSVVHVRVGFLWKTEVCVAHQWPREGFNDRLTIGSGARALMAIRPQWLAIDTARDVVNRASVVDLGTGGTLTTWSPEAGLQSGIPTLTKRQRLRLRFTKCIGPMLREIYYDACIAGINAYHIAKRQKQEVRAAKKAAKAKQ